MFTAMKSDGQLNWDNLTFIRKFYTMFPGAIDAEEEHYRRKKFPVCVEKRKTLVEGMMRMIQLLVLLMF